MAGISNYLETEHIDYLRGSNMPTELTTVYIGLNSADDDDGGSEVTTDYLSGRASYTTSDFTAPATVTGYRQIKNSTLITLGTAIDAAASVPNYSVWDSLSGGNCLWTGTFVDSLGDPTPLAFAISDVITVAINGLQLNLSIASTSIYLRDVQLNWLRGTTAPSAPTTYAGLVTAVDPNGTVTEVTTTVRVAGRLTVSAWDAIATDGEYKLTKNTNAVDFGNSAGTVTALSHVCIWDASMTGNLLKFGALSLARNVGIGDPVVWQSGKIVIKES
jgi:hypothetical protein